MVSAADQRTLLPYFGAVLDEDKDQGDGLQDGASLSETPLYLYDFETDPECRNNLIDKEKDKAREFHQKLVAFMRAQNSDKSTIDGFMSV